MQVTQQADNQLSCKHSQSGQKLLPPPQKHVVCPGCDLEVSTKELAHGTNAHCPHCDSLLYRGKELPLQHNLILAISGLFFFLPTVCIPFITINLINVNFSANLASGSFTLMNDGFFLLGLVVLFCSVIAPILIFSSILTTHWALKHRHFKAFQASLYIYDHLKHWQMLDVFLLSIAVAFFKLQEYSHITPQLGFAFIITSHLFAIGLVSRASVRSYWESWESASSYQFDNVNVHCNHCHLSQPKTEHCHRCAHKIHERKPFSIQKTWANLITAAIFLIPANVLIISVIFSNGKRFEDTIFSGVVSLVQGGVYGVAFIIFVASILVPVAKVIGLGYILICIHLKSTSNQYQQTKIFKVVKWIGKWSILDLFVISIIIALVDRDQILDFAPGPAALAFAGVVIFTMFAAESFDTRLIWDTPSTTNNENESKYEK